MLHHPWSASLLPRQVLGQNILGRLELLSKTLSRAGVADADLNAAIWSLWNYVMGATITRASFGLSAKDRADAQQRLEHLSGHHPAIERSRLLLRSEEHTSELQSLMRISYAVFCLKKQIPTTTSTKTERRSNTH